MSFLNPVNEPVLRFSSTDADAPQIDYNARVAGDVKTVLKACLVTGYGDKASAGWSVVNEVDHVAEFVSPSDAMSDYRLGINDTGTAKTDWYYQYQDARVDPAYSSPIKSFTFANKTHANNGWQLLVTQRGVVFIELVQHTAVSKLSARMTYWGQIKSGIPSVKGSNIVFFNIGHNAQISIPMSFYSSNTSIHADIEDYTSIHTSAATTNALIATFPIFDKSVVDLVSPIYITNSLKDIVIGELPPLLSKTVNNSADLYGITESSLEGRSVLSVCAGYADSRVNFANSYGRTFLIRTDYWGY